MAVARRPGLLSSCTSHPAFQESPDTSASTPTILLRGSPTCLFSARLHSPHNLLLPCLPSHQLPPHILFLGGKLHLSWSPSTHRQYSGIGIGMTLDNLTRSGWPACWVTRGGIKGKGRAVQGSTGRAVQSVGRNKSDSKNFQQFSAAARSRQCQLIAANSCQSSRRPFIAATSHSSSFRAASNVHLKVAAG